MVASAAGEPMKPRARVPSVSEALGATALTRIPRGASSFAMIRVAELRALLVPTYTELYAGWLDVPAVEMLTMDADGPRSSWVAKACIVRSGPSRLVFTCW